MKLLLPSIVMSNMFALHRSTFVLSDFTPDVVLSGFVDSLIMSFGGNISASLGCAMRAPTWLAKSSPCGFNNPFLGGKVFSGPIAPSLRVCFFVFFHCQIFLCCCCFLHVGFRLIVALLFYEGICLFFLDLCFLCLLRNFSNNLLSSLSLSSLVVASLSRKLRFIDILP